MKNRIYLRLLTILILCMLVLFNYAGNQAKGCIKIGWAMEDITPDGPVSLYGQYYERISKYVQGPLKATAFAIESERREGEQEQAIMISLDICTLSDALQDSLRNLLRWQLPGFNPDNLFLNATHTHSSFDVSQSGKHRGMLMERLCKVAKAAWEGRRTGGISRGLRYAAIGHNRRVCYAGGSTEMYGSADREDFIGLEGPEDPAVDMLFCWDIKKHLTGIIMNVACPAQVTEAKYFVSSDYWGELRRQLEKEYPGVYILPQISAAGDISPRDLPRGYKPGGPDMWDVPGIVEIGKSLMRVINDTYFDAWENIQMDVIFKHTVKDIYLPARLYSEVEYKNALAIVNKIKSKEPEDPNSPETAWNRFLKEIHENETTKEYGPWDNKLSDYGILRKQEALGKQYEEQDKHPFYAVELHIIRLGDVAFATNPFELFVDYGFRIEGRSKAKQTFIIQLSGGDGAGYLPTKRAITGEGYRGYSAMVNKVGPVGGQLLVDETVNLINALWETE